MSIKRILIANRGEIALRIHRAAHEMGIETVAVHSTADADAMHVRLADHAVCIGPPAATDSYLNVANIISAAEVSQCDAIHPGYGFLSENEKFAEIVEAHDIKWIGPKPEHIRTMGDKVAAKQTAGALGLPLVPGSDGAVSDYDEAKKIAKEIGYPVIIKAASGGGGRGMKVCESEDTIETLMKQAGSEAKAAFGDATVYIEKYLGNPRHIEFQVFGDGKGNAIHLGERDCSLQRRHQKVLEEAPSPVISHEERMRMGEVCSKAMRDMGYRGAGTIEFLWEDGEFYFIEMNTRLQVEHPVFTFAPSPGRVTYYHPAGGMHVRVDSGLYAGYSIPPYYDSMIAKLIVYGRNREGCIMRLRRALEEMVVEGVKTNIPLHQELLHQDDVLSGDYSIKWLEDWLAKRED
jgi:acetyl-CoA carboxylase biotin carboxylase subunit